MIYLLDFTDWIICYAIILIWYVSFYLHFFASCRLLLDGYEKHMWIIFLFSFFRMVNQHIQKRGKNQRSKNKKEKKFKLNVLWNIKWIAFVFNRFTHFSRWKGRSIFWINVIRKCNQKHICATYYCLFCLFYLFFFHFLLLLLSMFVVGMCVCG